MDQAAPLLGYCTGRGLGLGDRGAFGRVYRDCDIDNLVHPLLCELTNYLSLWDYPKFYDLIYFIDGC